MNPSVLRQAGMRQPQWTTRDTTNAAHRDQYVEASVAAVRSSALRSARAEAAIALVSAIDAPAAPEAVGQGFGAWRDAAPGADRAADPKRPDAPEVRRPPVSYLTPWARASRSAVAEAVRHSMPRTAEARAVVGSAAIVDAETTAAAVARCVVAPEPQPGPWKPTAAHHHAAALATASCAAAGRSSWEQALAVAVHTTPCAMRLASSHGPTPAAARTYAAAAVLPPVLRTLRMAGAPWLASLAAVRAVCPALLRGAGSNDPAPLSEQRRLVLPALLEALGAGLPRGRWADVAAAYRKLTAPGHSTADAAAAVSALAAAGAPFPAVQGWVDGVTEARRGLMRSGPLWGSYIAACPPDQWAHACEVFFTNSQAHGVAPDGPMVEAAMAALAPPQLSPTEHHRWGTALRLLTASTTRGVVPSHAALASGVWATRAAADDASSAVTAFLERHAEPALGPDRRRWAAPLRDACSAARRKAETPPPEDWVQPDKETLFF